MEKLLFRRSSAAPGSMTKESVHNNTSVTRRLIQKAHPGVTTILRRPATRSEPKEKKSHASRTNRERDCSRDTGEPLLQALEAVVETPPGRQLEEVRSGPHQDEEARYWQANLLFARVSEQAGHPPAAV